MFYPTGIKCKHEFCWDCLADYKAILAKDNSVHAAACKWHPNNLTSEVGVDSEAEDDDDEEPKAAVEDSEDEEMTDAEGASLEDMPAPATVTIGPAIRA